MLVEKRRNFASHFESAFDLSGCGLGIHSHAVKGFADRKDLAEWAKRALSEPRSNYLVNGYVFAWRNNEYDLVPYKKSPFSDAHLRLFNEMHARYSRLENIQTRLVLGGETALAVPDPQAPITTEEELTSLLVSAKVCGLITSDPITSPQIVLSNDGLKIKRLANIGIEATDKLETQWDAVKFSERFREATLAAAVYKLGAMLALTDQLTFDANALGIPFPPTYKPNDLDGIWRANWQAILNEQMPDLAGLYTQAHAVFVSRADQEDPLIAHLLNLDLLPQLGV